MSLHGEATQPRILILDDSDEDAKLIIRALARGGIDAHYEIVTTSDDFTDRLQANRYDLVLSDYRLPDWTGMDALRLVRNFGSNVPFILVSGTLGDDLAVECIKAGATDYVLKEKLDRLPLACRRALAESALRVDRDRAENEVRETAEQYRLLFQANPLPLWVFDHETLCFLAVNESAVRHYGYSREEFLNMTIRDIRPPEDIPALLRSVAHQVEGLSQIETWKHIKKDGTLIDVEITTHELRFRGKSAVLTLVHDITEQRKAQEALRHSEKRFATAFRSSPLPITICTRAEDRYVDVNDAFLKMTGFARADVVNRTAAELRFWLYPEDRNNMLQQLAAGNVVAGFETRVRTRSRDVRLAEISAGLVEFDGIQCILAITQDITEGRRLEEQFRQAQKMEAVGRLAGGIAHDFNNMLGVIIGNSDLLNERQEDEEVQVRVGAIKNAAERAASLTRQLLAFSRRQIHSPRVLNLNAVLHNLRNMLAHMIGEDIEFIVVPGEDLGSVRADPVQVEQAIMNLAVNARDAMPKGGKLVIRTFNADVDEAFASQHSSVQPGAYVVLSVSDTGCGMSEETLLHMFEPFYTTKTLGKGTGLGLSMVHGFVNQSSGGIWVYSELGKGTTFKIYLPRVDEEVSKEQPLAPPPVHTGSETILLVEDEEPLRLLIADILTAGGYKVLPAANGEEGLTIAQRQGPIDLLVTDVIMPGQSGSELAGVLRALIPKLKLLYMSGYTGDLITEHGGLEIEGLLLEKPFTKNSLLTKVRAILDR
jgi:two-component system, cell cycle sensor histidine kinase and response regulator CckA